MFKIGDKIVYPMHGAGVITGVDIKEILGEKREYYVIQMPIGDMKVLVPVDNVVEIGVRYIIEPEEIEGIIDILRGHKTAMPQNWNRRYRANMERIKTGDINEIAAVVRNLTIMDNQKGLSTGERKMLTNSRQMLLSELVLASQLSAEEIEIIVEEAILETSEIEDEDNF